MADRVFPSKPAPPPSAATAPNGPGATTNGGTTKTNLYNPNSRPPYRPPPYNRRSHHRSRRSFTCCCCCFWTILIFLILALLASIAGIVLYVMYKPHRPTFSIPSLRVNHLNLTTSADSSSSHISTLFNFTLSSKNPNNHITFFYDPFIVSSISNSGVFIGNGTFPQFISYSKNLTTFKSVLVSTNQDLDSDSVNGLRSDLKKKGGLPLKLQMDTKVEVKIDGLKSKKVGIRVTCEGIKATPPTGKTPKLANTSGAKCKVDLRIKIWKWTF